MKILGNDFHRREANRVAGEMQVVARERQLANAKEWARRAGEAILAGNDELAANLYAKAAALMDPWHHKHP